MSKPKQSSDENTASGLLFQLIREAEAEARAYLPSPPKNVKPAPWRKKDVTIVRADGRKEIARSAILERVAPFDPDEFVTRIPRDALLKPVPTDAAVKLDKYWRSFEIEPSKPTEYIPCDGTNSRIAINLLATCLLAQNEPKLSSQQLLVVGHNIGALRMILRMYSDPKVLKSQASHARDYRAERRALELFDSFRKSYPDAQLMRSEARALENATALDDQVIEQLYQEGYGSYSHRTVNKWRREGTPKAMRKRGRSRKT